LNFEGSLIFDSSPPWPCLLFAISMMQLSVLFICTWFPCKLILSNLSRTSRQACNLESLFW
jgi:hypothetical protein